MKKKNAYSCQKVDPVGLEFMHTMHAAPPMALVDD